MRVTIALLVASLSLTGGGVAQAAAKHHHRRGGHVGAAWPRGNKAARPEEPPGALAWVGLGALLAH
jgi:hypothetical protein